MFNPLDNTGALLVIVAFCAFSSASAFMPEHGAKEPSMAHKMWIEDMQEKARQAEIERPARRKEAHDRAEAGFSQPPASLAQAPVVAWRPAGQAKTKTLPRSATNTVNDTKQGRISAGLMIFWSLILLLAGGLSHFKKKSKA